MPACRKRVSPASRSRRNEVRPVEAVPRPAAEEHEGVVEDHDPDDRSEVVAVHLDHCRRGARRRDLERHTRVVCATDPDRGDLGLAREGDDGPQKERGEHDRGGPEDRTGAPTALRKRKAANATAAVTPQATSVRLFRWSRTDGPSNPTSRR